MLAVIKDAFILICYTYQNIYYLYNKENATRHPLMYVIAFQSNKNLGQLPRSVFQLMRPVPFQFCNQL